MEDGPNSPSAATACFSFTSALSPLASEVWVYQPLVVYYRVDPGWCHQWVEYSSALKNKRQDTRRCFFLRVQFSRAHQENRVESAILRLLSELSASVVRAGSAWITVVP